MVRFFFLKLLDRHGQKGDFDETLILPMHDDGKPVPDGMLAGTRGKVYRIHSSYDTWPEVRAAIKGKWRLRKDIGWFERLPPLRKSA